MSTTEDFKKHVSRKKNEKRDKRIDELKKHIKKYINTEISAKDKSYENSRPLPIYATNKKYIKDAIDAKIESEDPKRRRFLDFLVNVMGWIPANPNRQDLVKKLNAGYESFIISGQDRGYLPIANEYNSDLKCYNLEKLLVQKRKLAVVGRRGSGKTTFLNYWLNNNTKTVLEDKLGYFWIRVDASKVYDMWSLAHVDKEKCTLNNYTIAHTVMVFLIYGGVLDKFRNHDDSKQLKDLSNGILENSTKPADYRKAVGMIMESWSKYLENNKNDKDLSAHFVREIFTSGSEQQFSNYQTVFEEIIAECTIQGIKILSIIDGVDNISWTKGDPSYIQMCQEVTVLSNFLEEKLGKRNVRHLICCRPETVPEIEAQSGTVQYRADAIRVDSHKTLTVSDEYSICEVVPPKLEKIIEKKIQAVRDEAFSNERDVLFDEFSSIGASSGRNLEPSKEFELQLERITIEAKEYVANIEKSLSAIIWLGEKAGANLPLISNVDVGFLLNYLFNNNVRDFLVNFVKSQDAVFYCNAIGIIGAENSSRKIQYMFLNGYPYLDSIPAHPSETRYSKIPDGEVFPNIFWFDQSHMNLRPTQWCGLCGVRILQLVKARQNSQKCSDIMSLIKDLFCYPDDVIKECIEAFVAFGLLEVIEFARDQKPTIENCSFYDEYNYRIKITEKGKFFLEFSFVYPDLLYFGALDTPIHSSIAESTTLIRAFKAIGVDGEEFIFNFLDAYCITVPTFVRIIIHYHNEEMLKFKRKYESTTYLWNIFPNLDEALNMFGIPKHFSDVTIWHLGKSLEARYKDLKAFEVLENDILGWQVN